MKKVIVFLTLVASVLFAQPTVQIFEFPGSINGISDNGIYACGFDVTLGQSFIWTESGGKVLIGAGTEAFGISNNGTVAGRFLDPNTITNGNPTWVAAYYSGGQWHKVGGIPGIPPLDELSYTHAYSINATATKMTGMVWRPNYRVEACYWNLPDTSIHLLGQINGQSGRADDVSNDGSIIVGWSADSSGSPDREPYYWDPLPHFMGSLDSTWDGGECNGISPDGNILVGNSSALAFQYTQTNGMQPITDPSLGYWNGWSSDVSNNGTVVGHIDEGLFTYRASIKLAEWQYTILLDTYLKDSLGIPGISDWYCLFNRGISANGKIFGGEMVNNTYPFGGAFIVNTEYVIPVELVSFTCIVNNNSVSLNWATSTETNNLGFEIERRTESSEFRTIGFIEGYGTTTEPNSYKFVDKNADPGINYYRLKQVDFDGSYAYSDIVEVDVPAPLTFDLAQNYPNPFNPTTTINFVIPTSELVKLTIYNSLGQEVAVLVNEVVSAGQHSITFDAAGLASGVYLAKMNAGSFVEVRKMNLLK